MKKRTIIDIFIMILLLGLLIFLGTRDYDKKNEGKDSKRFDHDYSMVSKDNVFKYVSEEEFYNLLKDGDAVVFMGFKENEWSNYYAKMLNDAAKEVNLKEIYYYDFLADREKKSVMYGKIIDFLRDYLQQDDQGNVNLVAPSLLIIKDHVITYYDSETSYTNANVTPKKYWNDVHMQAKTEKFINAFNNYLAEDEAVGGQDGGEE